MESKYILRNEGILINDRGAWLSGEDYVAGDLVQNSGSYICKVSHTASAATEPGVGGSSPIVWKALQTVAGTYESQYFKAHDIVPYYRLEDGGGNNVYIKLQAGILEVYDIVEGTLLALDASSRTAVITGALSADSANFAGALTAAAMSVSGGVGISGALTVGTAKTDHQMSIPIAPGAAISGTWTTSVSSNVMLVTRTAVVGATQYRLPISLPARGASGKGAKLQSVTICYTAGGTLDTANDQILAQIVKVTMPENGSSPVGTILAGDADVDYDASHDSKAKRLTAATHTMTVTIPSGEQAYMAAGEQLCLDILVTDAATANLTFALKGAVANYAAAEY